MNQYTPTARKRSSLAVLVKGRLLLRNNPFVERSPDRFITSAATRKSCIRANIYRIDRMNVPVGSPQRIMIRVHIRISARMMTAIEEQVALQPQRVPLNLFVVLSVVDPGPSAGAKVWNDFSAYTVAEIGILTSR